MLALSLIAFAAVSNHQISAMGLDEKRDLLWCVQRISLNAGCVLIAFDYEMLMKEQAQLSNVWGIQWNYPLHSSASKATKHRIDLPHGIYDDLVVSPEGVVFIVDATGEVIKFDPRTDGAQPELVSEGDGLYSVPSIAYHDSGVLIVANSVQQTLHRIDPTTGERTTIRCCIIYHSITLWPISHNILFSSFVDAFMPRAGADFVPNAHQICAAPSSKQPMAAAGSTSA